jgi:hypothetical protein
VLLLRLPSAREGTHVGALGDMSARPVCCAGPAPKGIIGIL